MRARDDDRQSCGALLRYGREALAVPCHRRHRACLGVRRHRACLDGDHRADLACWEYQVGRCRRDGLGAEGRVDHEGDGRDDESVARAR